MVITFWFWFRTWHADESERPSRWITYRRWIHIILLALVAVWWALCDLRRAGSSVHLSQMDSVFFRPVLFWALPVSVVAAIQLFCYSRDRTFLGRRWTTTDTVRLAFWRTISPTFALLLVAAAFNALYGRNLVGFFWLFAAAIAALVGTSRLRAAEGLNFRRVKSGELYKRAITMAREMKVSLKEVSVVPAGRGRLTNAYGLSKMIAVTDNYGKFLSSAELDSVIAHELGHLKARHGRKKLLLIATVFVVGALIAYLLPATSIPFRPLFDILIVFVPILMLCSLSRRFEYAADRFSVDFTRNPDAAVQSLTNLHRITETPTHFDRLIEPFMTHPSLTRRIRAIREEWDQRR